MKNDLINETELRRALNVIQGNALFEIRALKKNPKRTLSGYFHDVDTAVSALMSNNIDLRGFNVYMSLNELTPECYDRSQRNKMMIPEVTSNDDVITAYKWLFVDLDPVRIADTSATDEQLNKARIKAAKIQNYLKSIGFEDPVIAMSGNGIHLLYRIALINNADNEALIQKCLQALSLMFSDDDVKVDTANFNPARICKLYGTLAQKGSGTEERPHRMSYIIKAPEVINKTPKAYVEKLAAELPQTEKPQAYNNYAPSKFDVKEWMQNNGLTYTEKADGTYTKYILDHCPFNSDHKAPDSMITVGASGAIGFKCLHNSCQGKTWRDVRLRYEPHAYDYHEDDERIDAGWKEHKKHNRDIKIDYTEPEIETDDEPYFLTAMDILKRPNDGEEYIRSGIEGIDNRLGGLKKKYVTLMTGLRGGSKSTLLTTIALTAIQDGNNVLCYSGELSDKDFMKWMNLQAAGKNHVHESKMRRGFYYPDDGTEEQIAKWLGNHFWLWNNFHGNNFNKIYKRLVSKIEEQKSDLVILDNLMAIDIHDLNERDKYAAQGEFVELLMQLAKKTNTHIIFVAHPRKAYGLLRLDDVAGTGNLTNRIDNALIVHRNNQDFQRLSKEMFKWKDDHDAYRGTNVIDIAKDRHNGHMDVFIPLWYEKETKRLKNSPAEMIQYGWDTSDGFVPIDGDEIPFV